MANLLDSVPGYIIGPELARTDLAIVYRGENERNRRPVAMKLVRNDARGRREVEMLNRVAQANRAGLAHVMRLEGVHEDEDNLWIALELFSGTLEDINHHDMTPLALMSITGDATKGLTEMHGAGVVDDDVKPANIAFKEKSGRVAHLDLGCARLRGERPVGYSDDFGAPEVAKGIASDTSPCFSLARTIEYLVTGKTGLGPDYLLCDYVPWVGRKFAATIAQCCRAEPHKRPTVTEFYDRVKTQILARQRCRKCNAIRFGDGVCPCC